MESYERSLKRNSFQLVNYFIRMYPWKSVIISTCLLISGLIEGLGLSAILPLLNLMVQGKMDVGGILGSSVQRILSFCGVEASVSLFLILILIAFLLKATMTFLAMRYASLTAAGIAVNLKMNFLRSLMNARWDYFLSHPSGRFAGALSTESEQAADSYVFACKMLTAIIQMGIYLAITFVISWKVSLFALIAGGGSMAVLNIFVEKMRHAIVHFINLFHSVNSKLIDALQGIKSLKAMALENRTESLLAPDINDLKRYRRKADMSKVSLDVLREPFQLVAVVACFYFAFKILNIGFEVLATNLFLFTRILDSAGRFQINHQNLVRHESMFWSMQSLIAETTAEKEVISGGGLPTLGRNIRLDGVTFSRGTKPILKNASMQVPAGQLTMLVGPTGSGKTTTADLIIGLIRPEAGEVWVDSVPLHDLDMKAWRSMVGYVPQELFLFHDTVLRNVTLGDSKFSSEEAEAMLRVTGAWEFVAALPDGIHSVVGERGAKLSGGQRQRIAIARALIRKPKLLILDEATSGLDPGAEESLFMSLRRMSEPLTIFAISHRSSFSKVADIIYAIEEGEIKTLEKGPENHSMLSRQ